MSAKVIRRIVEIVIGLFFIGGFLMIGRATAQMFDGQFGTVTWPVQAGAYDLEVAMGERATTSFVDGTLSVSGMPFWHAIDLTFSIAAIGIFITALMLLRGVLASFTRGDLVTAENAGALRKIGWLLLAACVLSVVHALVLQPAIISAVDPAEGTILHPSLSWNVKGMTNIWLHYDVPVFTLVLGGLALLFAEAFRVGTAYRKDSESVV